MSASALAERITAARKAAGVSQADAAHHLGMSRPTYIAIEKGTREVKSHELLSLAELYRTQVSRLVRPDAPIPVIAPHLRAEISGTEGDSGVGEALEKLASFVDDYRFLLEKTNTRFIPVVPPPTIERSQLSVERVGARVAQDERNRLGLGEREPIANLRKTLDEVGVQVFADALNSKLAGLYTFVPGFGYCILVNRLHPLARMRWTVAHEYGHFLFDRDKPGVDYVSSPQRRPEGERFADAFASNFLMPAGGVQRHFDDAKARTGDVNVGDVIRIADVYGVSLMAMTLRMEDMRLIQKGTWDLIKASGAKVGDLKRELGLESVAPQEKVETFPRRYLWLAVQAWTSETITTSQFAKLVRLSPIEARALAEEISRMVVDDVEELPILKLKLSTSVLEREKNA